MGDDYWTPEIIASNQRQAETGKIPVSGAGYGGPFAGPGFDSMWTDMSEIVRPTRDGIHGREYISTSVDIGRVCQPSAFHPSRLVMDQGTEAPYPRVEVSIPFIFDLLPFRDFPPAVLSALARAAKETNTLMILQPEAITEELSPWAGHLVPLLPPGRLDGYIPLLRQSRMVQLPFYEKTEEKVGEIKRVNPEVVVSVRLSLTPQVEENVEALERSEIEVLHLLADEKGREQKAANPRFIKDRIRDIHQYLVRLGRRDGVTLIFGGGIALAEHVAKAIICGADAVSIERPLLMALDCRLCGDCGEEKFCPVEVEKVDPGWGRQRVVNLVAAWHGQLLEVLGAMGMRDVRRLRGEVGRAIFKEDIEKETFGKIFGERAKTRWAGLQPALQGGEIHGLAP
jgi:hypothetical protein